MTKNNERLTALSKGAKSRWLENAEKRKESEKWSERSTKIALNVLDILRQKNMSKQELADRMQVSAQYISKLVKGKENLTLETIAKLESALGVKMIDIKDFSSRVQVKHWSNVAHTKTIQRSMEQCYRYKIVPNSYSYAC